MPGWHGVMQLEARRAGAVLARPGLTPSSNADQGKTLSVGSEMIEILAISYEFRSNGLDKI